MPERRYTIIQPHPASPVQDIAAIAANAVLWIAEPKDASDEAYNRGADELFGVGSSERGGNLAYGRLDLRAMVAGDSNTMIVASSMEQDEAGVWRASDDVQVFMARNGVMPVGYGTPQALQGLTREQAAAYKREQEGSA